MLVDEFYLRGSFMGRSNNKVVNQKFAFQKYWKRLLKKITVNDASTTIRINQVELNKYILKIKIKFEVLVMTLAIESLLYLNPSQAKDKFLYHLKH